MEPEEASSPKSAGSVSDVNLASLFDDEPGEDLFENASSTTPEISIDALGSETGRKAKKAKKDKKRKQSDGSLSSDDDKPLSSSVGSKVAKDSKATPHQKQLAVAKSPQDFLSELMETHKVICELCGVESTAQDA